MHTILHEFRYALRQLRKSPGFALVSVLTLALGIGANIAVFSVTNAVLLNPSGIPHADGLVALRARYGAMPDLNNISLSAPDFGDAADGKNIFSSGAVMQPGSFNYARENTNPELLNGARVSSGWFDTFDVRPYLGRVFTPEEDQPGAGNEAVLSYRAWQKRFGSDPNIVGQTLTLNNQAYRVVGVMGPSFNWPNLAELWVPIAFPPSRYHDPDYRYNENLFAVARLKRGVTLQLANAYLNRKADQNIASEGSKSFGRASRWGMFSLPLTEFIGGSLRKPLTMLLIAVGMVLLIACANIAGLQMARASARERDLAIRVALGAQRVRLLRQALVESIVLTVAGVALGFAVALATVPLLLHYLPALLGTLIQPSFRGPVLLFVTGIAVFCSLLCGLVPAWQRTQPGWFNALQEGGRSGIGGLMHQRTRSSLVVAQIALSLLLLTGAGLLLTSLRALEQVETGFQPSGLLSARFSLPQSIYGVIPPVTSAPAVKDAAAKEAVAKAAAAAQAASDAKVAAFLTALQDRLLSIPGVSSAGLADSVPFDNQGGSSSFYIEGRPPGPNDPGPHGNVHVVSPNYFPTLRVPLMTGRDFAPQDRQGTELVAIVDTVLAHQYWPGRSPIGEHIGFDDRVKGPWYTIVGVVGHARATSLESDTNEGFFYLSTAQAPQLSTALLARSSRSPDDLKGDLAAAVRSVDPSVPIYDVKTMEERVDDSLVGRRFVVLLLTTFAGLALLLAALGLYGVISYSVRMRTRELGVRIALGAQRGTVMQLVLLQGLRLAVIGVVLGALSALAFSRIFSSLLFKVGMLNPLPWVAAMTILVATVLLASYLPARRAASIEPMKALRTE
jgi:ABC-type antimicrobial peptide transport system permease subunit